jgi:dCTP deaminase
MILSGPEIAKQIELNAITMKPYDPSRLNPNSIDLSLGDTLLRYRDGIIDPRVEPHVEELTIPSSGLTLEAGGFCLGASRETVGSAKFVPIVHGKSSTARAGLFVHVTADLIDIGSIGTITFQLYSSLSIVLYPGMLIAQMSFWVPMGEIALYAGKYQGSNGPAKSQIFRDPFWKGFDP